MVLAFVVSPFAVACYCIFHPGKFGTSLSDLRPPGFYAIGEQWTSHHTSSYSIGFESRYRVGMSRDQIQMNFKLSGARLIASDSRPDQNWGMIGKGREGLAHYVREFESNHHTGVVAACDVYDDGKNHHVLFFDKAELLLGVQVFPSFICLS